MAKADKSHLQRPAFSQPGAFLQRPHLLICLFWVYRDAPWPAAAQSGHLTTSVRIFEGVGQMTSRNPVPVVGDIAESVRLRPERGCLSHEDDLLDRQDTLPRNHVSDLGAYAQGGPVKRVAAKPISIRSPWTAELTKFISDMYLVTACPLPS